MLELFVRRKPNHARSGEPQQGAKKEHKKEMLMLTQAFAIFLKLTYDYSHSVEYQWAMQLINFFFFL